MYQKLLKYFVLFNFFIIFSVSIFSQNNQKGTINGRILDQDKKIIETVLIYVKGMNNGVYTDELGQYTISDIPVGNQTLEISGVGVQEKSVPVKIEANKVVIVPDIIVKNSYDLGEVVITAKTDARRQQDLAYPVTVLDVRKNYNTTTSLSKLLNNVSSVRVREDGGVGSNYSFNINGFSGKQVKFFLDGIPMDNFGSSFNLSSISMSMVDRIDVYKGVVPINLGADALGGAVNLITRKKANYIDASYSLGSFNTQKLSLNGAYTNLKTGFTFRTNSFFNYSDNDYKVFVPIIDLNTNQEIGYRNVKRFNDNYRSGGVRMETGLVGKSYADYLLFGLIWSKDNADVQNGATMDAVYGGVKSKSESLVPSVRWKKDDLFVDGLSVSLYGSYNKINNFAIDTLSRKYNWLGESVPKTTRGEMGATPTDSKIKDREWVANTNISYMLNMHQSLTLNSIFSDNKRSIYDKMDIDNESNKIPKKLAKNIIGLGWLVTYDKWNVNLFAKMYNLHTSSTKLLDQFTETQRIENLIDNSTDLGYGGAFSYSIFSGFQAKFSYEHAYRLPDSNEIFGDGLYQKANLDLKPERSDNVNLGLIYGKKLGDHFINLEANGIFRNAKDFIRKDVNQAASNPTSGYLNIGKVRTWGVEGNINYRWKFAQIGTSITYQNIRDKQKTEFNDNSYVGSEESRHLSYGERVPNIPYLFGNANAGLKFSNIGWKGSDLGVDYVFDWLKGYYLSFPGLGARSTKKIIPSQASHDISVSYSLENGKYNIALGCTNFTNKRLYDNYRLQKPGRAFSIKFRYFIGW